MLLAAVSSARLSVPTAATLQYTLYMLLHQYVLLLKAFANMLSTALCVTDVHHVTVLCTAINQLRGGPADTVSLQVAKRLAA
jgi:hypothetical protein